MEDIETKNKSELRIALIWMIIYLVGYNAAAIISNMIKFPNSITAIIGVLLPAVIIVILKRSNKLEYNGIRSLKKLNIRNLLYFIPMIAVASVNLWFGININNTFIQIVLITISMLGVGFLEEIIFRSFLIRAIMKKSVVLALIISSIAFGMIHMLNVFMGADIVSTIFQVIYASAFGFMYYAFFLKTNNIIPCMICHWLTNAFAIYLPISLPIHFKILQCIAITVFSLLYGVYLLKTKKELVKKYE